MYGDVECSEKSKSSITTTLNFSMVAVSNDRTSKEMAAYADTIVVGNQLYDNLEEL